MKYKLSTVNSVPSAICGIALVAALCLGCAHEQFVSDADHPEIAVTRTGIVTYRGKSVDAEDLPGLLRDSGLDRTATVYIHIPDGLSDYRTPYYVMGVLVRAGYRRPIMVEDRKSSSAVTGGKNGRESLRPPRRR